MQAPKPFQRKQDSPHLPLAFLPTECRGLHSTKGNERQTETTASRGWRSDWFSAVWCCFITLRTKVKPFIFFHVCFNRATFLFPWNFGWGPYHQNYQGQPNLKHLWKSSILTVKSRAAHTPQNFHEFPLFPVYKQWLLETTEVSAVTFADSKSRVGCSCWLFAMILGTAEEQLLSQKGKVHKLFFLPILPSFPLLSARRGQALQELSLPPVTRQSRRARPITVAASGKTGSFANSDCTFSNSNAT